MAKGIKIAGIRNMLSASKVKFVFYEGSRNFFISNFPFVAV